MFRRKRLSVGFSAFGIVTVSVSCCVTLAAQPNGTSNAVPVEIAAMPGGMASLQGWPLKGADPQDVGGMFEVNYNTSGPIIGGVHWTWPSTDKNPEHYVVVPTTIQGKPYLVWCHLPPEKKVGKPDNGIGGYDPNQLEPIGPSQMWMTQWNRHGGSLSKGAKLITNDIPPSFSSSGQYVFPSNPRNTNPQSLAGSAWTGWFQWGDVIHPCSLPDPKPSMEPTVAVPSGLFPAYNGVVLEMQTQVLLANQGQAINLYYLNLANRHIVGLASLTLGGGLFFSMRVVSGMAFTGSATDLTADAQIKATAFVYNEVTGKRTQVESSAVMSQNNGFNDWTIHGSSIYDANDKLVANLNLPASAVSEPSAATFGVSN